MLVTEKDKEDAIRIAENYGIYAEEFTLKRLTESIANIRAASAAQALNDAAERTCTHCNLLKGPENCSRTESCWQRRAILGKVGDEE